MVCRAIVCARCRSSHDCHSHPRKVSGCVRAGNGGMALLLDACIHSTVYPVLVKAYVSIIHAVWRCFVHSSAVDYHHSLLYWLSEVSLEYIVCMLASNRACCVLFNCCKIVAHVCVHSKWRSQNHLSTIVTVVYCQRINGIVSQIVVVCCHFITVGRRALAVYYWLLSCVVVSLFVLKCCHCITVVDVQWCIFRHLPRRAHPAVTQ